MMQPQTAKKMKRQRKNEQTRASPKPRRERVGTPIWILQVACEWRYHRGGMPVNGGRYGLDHHKLNSLLLSYNWWSLVSAGCCLS